MDPDNINGTAVPANANAQPASAPADAQPSSSNQSPTPSSPPQSGSVETASLTLEELNKLTGRNFPTKDSALKAIGDTFSFVGKKKETVAQELQNTGEYISKKELDTEFFYKENKLASDNRKLIDSFAKANNISAREAVNYPELKSILEKVKGYEDSQAVKSVIETNPRLASVRTATDTIKTSIATGNKEEAKLSAARAVREALEI